MKENVSIKLGMRFPPNGYLVKKEEVAGFIERLQKTMPGKMFTQESAEAVIVKLKED